MCSAVRATCYNCCGVFFAFICLNSRDAVQFDWQRNSFILDDCRFRDGTITGSIRRQDKNAKRAPYILSLGLYQAWSPRDMSLSPVFCV